MLFETILSDRKRKEKLKFSMIKLSIGDELEYVEDPSIKVKIVDDMMLICHTAIQGEDMGITRWKKLQ